MSLCLGDDMEDDAWIEAWIRKKPRRVIHNQFLIEIFFALAFITPFPITGVSIWLIFGFYPIVVVPAILIAWLLVFISYTTLKLYHVIQKKNH